jgi:uncharacterized protein YecE (DUF72 family)
MGDILVGTSSWADRLLLASGWYPRDANTPASRLAYYSSRFDLVEVDTSFYAIPDVKTVTTWVESTPDWFVFDVKAFSLFTGHGAPTSTLPADLRPSGAERRVRRSDLPAALYDSIWDRFHESLAPMAAAGKLGSILLQFPPWLRRGAAAEKRITEAVERCRPLRVAVELRHPSWFDHRHVLDSMRFLQDLGASYCCVDMPQGFESSVPPLLVATAEPAMIRFHGRSKLWETGDKQERYKYAYSEQELADWSQRLRMFSEQVESLHVLMNNCCGDQAQRDAAHLHDLLDHVEA